jgi:hypothetical protein
VAGCPILSRFFLQKGGRHQRGRQVQNPNASRASGSHPCKERKDGAPSVVWYREKKFGWATRPVLTSPEPLSAESIAMVAEKVGLDIGAFRVCVDSDRYRNRIEADAAEAAELRIHGTPTFVIASSDEHQLKGGRLVGAVSYVAFQSRIDQALAKHSER